MIEVSNVDFSYRGNRKLFDALNLQFEMGRVYGLLGRNGAGKTSLIQLILGMNRPNLGACKIDGFNTKSRSAQILSNIFFQPEDVYIPRISGKKYISLYACFYKNFSMEKFDRLKDEMGIITDRNLATLSMGEKKKFFIGFGLATNSRYIFLDEPTNGLDIPSKSVFRKAVASSISDKQVVVISTHQVADVETLIDSLVVLEGGRIFFNDYVSEITDNYVVKTLDSVDESDLIIYHEQYPTGYVAVMPGRPGKDGKVLDLEMVFKTIIYGKQRFNKEVVNER
ncbi:MAG: ABC transporter ATP-binding protein [Spirochaetales bacterium]|nr:ABC transporter ATP-binding protein [Spirochaetales bacterium]